MSQSSPESKQKWIDVNRHRRPAINRSNKLRNFYGISPEDYQKMLEAQEHRCLICRRQFVLEPRNNERYPHLDHDHGSGWIRGILCSNCNAGGIGMLGDDCDLLQSAVEYLISNATPTEFSIIEARACLRKKSRGNTLTRTEETKQRLRTAKLGTPAWNKGKAWDEKTRIKMSESAIARWANADEAQKAPLLANLAAGRTSEAANKKWKVRLGKF